MAGTRERLRLIIASQVCRSQRPPESSRVNFGARVRYCCHCQDRRHVRSGRRLRPRDVRRGEGARRQRRGGRAVRGARQARARGVYRVPVWPYRKQAPYAIPVRATGEGAYLYGESVVALLGLSPTDPRAIRVAAPRRTRRSLGEGVRLVWRRSPVRVTLHEGISFQEATGAIRGSGDDPGVRPRRRRGAQGGADWLRRAKGACPHTDRALRMATVRRSVSTCHQIGHPSTSE